MPSRVAAARAATLVFASVLAGASAPGGPALPTFPHAEADTIDGEHVVFPQHLDGKPAIFLISLTRGSSENLRQLGTQLTQSVGQRAPVYVVVAAEGTPFFIKGMMRHEILRQAPPPPPGQHSRVLLTFDNDGWKNVVGPGDDADPAIVVVGGDGTIVFDERSAANPTIVDQTLHALP